MASSRARSASDARPAGRRRRRGPWPRARRPPARRPAGQQHRLELLGQLLHGLGQPVVAQPAPPPATGPGRAGPGGAAARSARRRVARAATRRSADSADSSPGHLLPGQPQVLGRRHGLSPRPARARQRGHHPHSSRTRPMATSLSRNARLPVPHPGVQQLPDDQESPHSRCSASGSPTRWTGPPRSRPAPGPAPPPRKMGRRCTITVNPSTGGGAPDSRLAMTTSAIRPIVSRSAPAPTPTARRTAARSLRPRLASR